MDQKILVDGFRTAILVIKELWWFLGIFLMCRFALGSLVDWWQRRIIMTRY